MTSIPPLQTPPPQPFIEPPTPRSKWPTVIGVLSTVFGALALICTPLGAASQAMTRNLPNQPDVMQFFPEWFRDYQTLSMFLGMGVGVLELIAGVTLLKRLPVARPLHLALGFIGAVVAVINVIVMSSLDLSAAPAAFRATFRAGMMMGIPLGLAYPVFLLIWFFRGKIVAEVRNWGQKAQ